MPGPTARHEIGFLWEKIVNDAIPREFKRTNNPLDSIWKWLRHVGKGIDFVFEVGGYKIGVECKFSTNHLSAEMIAQHVIPRFKTDKYGEPIRLDYKILCVNEELKISKPNREYLRENDIRVYTIEELKGFLYLLHNTHRRYYSSLLSSNLSLLVLPSKLLSYVNYRIKSTDLYLTLRYELVTRKFLRHVETVINWILGGHHKSSDSPDPFLESQQPDEHVTQSVNR